ncbi:MAG: hypothetical protein ACT4PV_12085 [Planctomycetaceae bacterium]
MSTAASSAPAQEPKGVKIVSLLVAALGLYFLVAGLGGKPGAFRVLFVLAGTGFLLAIARGLARFRTWSWFATCIGMLAGAAVTFVRILLAVDAKDSPEIWERLALLGFLVALLLYLSREKIERFYRPDYFRQPVH